MYNSKAEAGESPWNWSLGAIHSSNNELPDEEVWSLTIEKCSVMYIRVY